ncbi:MAG: LysR family transcriptional regulator [Myxococcota bacterium]
MERLHGLDLNLLVALDALLDAGSVTGAATVLGVTQPAVSQRLRRLRDALDDPLFVQAARGLKPTAKALAMRAPLRATLDQLADVVLGEAPFDPATDAMEFIVAAPDLFEFVALPGILELCAREAPSVRVRVVPPTPDVGARLEAGTVQFLIGPYAPDMPGLRRAKLNEDGFTVLARPGHPLLRGRLTLAKYLRASHAVVCPQGTPGTFIDAALAEQGKTRHCAVQVRSFLAVPFVVAQSDLFATVPTSLAESIREAAGVCTAPLPLQVPAVPSFLTWHERFERASANRWFRETARSFTAADRG